MSSSLPALQQITALASRVWRILISPSTPWYVKLMLILGLMYCVSPLDLIPEWVPVLGVLDDLGLATLIIAAVLKMVPDESGKL